MKNLQFVDSTFTVVELKEIAKENGLKGYSRLRKAELIDFINENIEQIKPEKEINVELRGRVREVLDVVENALVRDGLEIVEEPLNEVGTTVDINNSDREIFEIVYNNQKYVNALLILENRSEMVQSVESGYGIVEQGSKLEKALRNYDDIELIMSRTYSIHGEVFDEGSHERLEALFVMQVAQAVRNILMMAGNLSIAPVSEPVSEPVSAPVSDEQAIEQAMTLPVVDKALQFEQIDEHFGNVMEEHGYEFIDMDMLSTTYAHDMDNGTGIEVTLTHDEASNEFVIEVYVSLDGDFVEERTLHTFKQAMTYVRKIEKEFA